MMISRFLIACIILVLASGGVMAQSTAQATQVVTFSVSISHQPSIVQSQHSEGRVQDRSSDEIMTITSGTPAGSLKAGDRNRGIASLDAGARDRNKPQYAIQTPGETLTP